MYSSADVTTIHHMSLNVMAVGFLKFSVSQVRKVALLFVSNRFTTVADKM